ncbi:MAG: hypothetical protein HQ578_01175 [Chloroflexi bacterium]|nr:hypothetical protein [Chloroflexota bacterium]
MKRLAGRLAGIENIKTAQTRGVRSVPCDGDAAVHLEMYMLLKQKERLEKRQKQNDEGKLEAVLRRIQELQESLPSRHGKAVPTKGRVSDDKASKKTWNVMGINY